MDFDWLFIDQNELNKKRRASVFSSKRKSPVLSPERLERAKARIKQTPLYQEYLKDRMSIEPRLRRFFDRIGGNFPMPKDDEAFRLFLESDENF